MARATADMASRPGAIRGLASVLAAILPTPAQTHLLRACLFDGEDSQLAWRHWCATVGNPKAAFAHEWQGCRALLPLLHHRLGDGATVDQPFQPYLRAAALHEELRVKVYRNVCATAFQALGAAGIPFIVTKGAALAETVYPTPELRHSHDVDVLVADADLSGAVERLAAAGFRPGPGQSIHSSHRSVVHECGLPVSLHSRLFRVGYYGLTYSELTTRSSARELAGVPARVLSSSDQLAHVIGQAFCSNPRTHLLWACDAVFLLQRAGDFSWPDFVDAVARGHLALPVLVLLRYLVAELAAPFPNGTLDQIRTLAIASNETDCEIALHLARRAVGLRALLRQSPALRRWMVRRMAFPSAVYRQAVVPEQQERPLLLWYARRALGYARRRIELAKRNRATV